MCSLQLMYFVIEMKIVSFCRFLIQFFNFKLIVMEFTIKAVFNALPSEIYKAWLSSEGHTEMTGGEADISDQVGDGFTAWDGYIEGVNVELDPNKCIVQAWRTTEFDVEDEDSVIEVTLNEVDGKTELTLHHTNLAENGGHYEQGWKDHYFEPMQDYFS